MHHGRAFSLQIFMPSGEPNGLRLIEKTNWTGLGLAFPRTRLGEARSRPELARPGVYVLCGPGDEAGFSRIYIGEGDAVGVRLAEHNSRKEFWTEAVAFVSRDANLDKAHVRYLESRLIELATSAARAEIDNDKNPAPPPFSEAAKASAESFLEDVLVCLRALGRHEFDAASALVPAASQSRGDPSAPPVFIYQQGDAYAEAIDTPEGFLVLKGARARRQTAPKFGKEPYNESRYEMIESGKLQDRGDHFELVEDWLAKHQSEASVVLYAAGPSHRTQWKTRDGLTLKQWQDGDE